MRTHEERIRAAVDELAERYRQRGYAVEQPASVSDDLRADLIARRESETVLIEARELGASPPADELRKLAEFARAKAGSS